MIILYILLAILALVLLLLGICVIRALAIKPTPAKTAVIKAECDEPTSLDRRSLGYGQRLGEMIKCETISSRFEQDLNKFYAFHQQLEQLFPNIHRVCEKHVLGGSLLFKWSGQAGLVRGGGPVRGGGESMGEPVLLMSHQDVVEATGEWQHDPFCGEVIDGKVWGRGTVDTKGNLFCFMQAVEELIAEGFTPPCDVYLASSCTEEFSGEGAPLTVQWLKDHGVHLRMMLDEGGMIMDNPIGGLSGTYAMVGVLEKGYGDLKFIARTQGGHASAPGKNTALVRLAKFITDVNQKPPFTPRLSPTVEEMFTRFAPNMDFALKLVLSNMWLFKPILPKLLAAVNPLAGAMIKTTIAFTMAKGSEGLNVLPQEAYVTGNLRFTHHQDDVESIRIITERAKQFDLETEIIYTDKPCPIVDYKGEAFQLVEGLINEIYPGVGVSPYVMTGGTDSKFYKEICENSIRFAPLYINEQQFKSIHGLDENIDAAALPLAVDFYRSFLHRI